MSPADLARDTAVVAVPKVPGTYVCALPDHWNYFNPCGGVLMTIALRAMVAELSDPGLFLLSATTIFCQAVQPGDVTVEVKVLRRGDSAAQLRACLTGRNQPGPGLEVTATFVRERPGPDVLGVEMPSVPGPDEAVKTTTRRGEQHDSPFNIYKHLELALAIGEPMWKPGWSAGPAHAGFWYRYKVPQRDAHGHFDPLALPPIADTMPPALARKLGPDHERLLMPSLDLTVYFLAPAHGEWILVESFAERARAGFAVASANLWDERGELVARAAQTMTLRKRKPRA
ncbi:MAG: thioesterase family protein [Polyangiaceae bacterium]|nr:thioesterase family protein [Polyangiaceae bacterium]MBK8940748.1 thioesterase family protein [Polyangiaceae bacterium]